MMKKLLFVILISSLLICCQSNTEKDSITALEPYRQNLGLDSLEIVKSNEDTLSKNDENSSSDYHSPPRSHIFNVKYNVLTINGNMTKEHYDNQELEIIDIGQGLYKVGLKDNTLNDFAYLIVKFDNKSSIYLYSIVSKDNAFENVKYIGSDVKLSDMSIGEKGDLIIYYSETVNLFISTK
jgi:uncharacterized protein YcfL